MEKLYKLFLSFVFVLLQSNNCFSISNSSQPSQNLVSTSPNSFYGYAGNLVFKQDSLGNTLWVKDFSGFISAQNSDSNNIQTITTDGKFIYLGEIQGHDSSNTGYYDPAIIVMDTNGLVVKIKYDQWSLIGNGRYYFNPAVPSNKTGGAWFLGSFNAGIGEHIVFYKVDSSGVVNLSFEIRDYSYNYLSKFSELNDSSFLAQTVSTSGLWLPDHYLVKLNDSGNIEWSKRISNTGFVIECGNSGIDFNNGNVCIFYTKDSGTLNAKTEALLFSRTGSLILQREWPDSLIHANGIFKYINNRFCYDDGRSLFKFDSFLVDSCLGLGLNPGFTIQNFTAPNTFLSFQDSSSFNPLNSNQMSVTPISNNGVDSTSQEYCFVLSSDQHFLSQQNTIIVFPSPVNTTIHIKLNLHFGSFQISDINGRIIKIGEIHNDINVEDLIPGIYFLELQDRDCGYVGRFIKL